MNCLKVQDQLVAYSDQEVREDHQLFIKEHLAVCPKCQSVSMGLSCLNTLLRQQPEQPVPFGFSARVLDQLAKEQVVQPVRWTFPRLVPLPVLVQGMAVVLVALIGLHIGGTFPSGKEEWRQQGGKEGIYFELLSSILTEENGDGLWYTD